MNMRKTLGDPCRDAWDSWPERAWKHDNESVEFVKARIQKARQSALTE